MILTKSSFAHNIVGRSIARRRHPLPIRPHAHTRGVIFRLAVKVLEIAEHNGTCVMPGVAADVFDHSDPCRGILQSIRAHPFIHQYADFRVLVDIDDGSWAAGPVTQRTAFLVSVAP